MGRKIKIVIILVLIGLLIISNERNKQNALHMQMEANFIQSDSIVVVLKKDTGSYFLYRGQARGFQMDLIDVYAGNINKNVKYVIENDIDKRLQMLANHEVDMVVCTEKIDSVKELENVYVTFEVNNKTQPAIWVVNIKNKALAKNMNLWLMSYKKTPSYARMERSYLKSKSSDGKHLSPYDELIQKYSNNIGWDWRLVAALIYQESKFDSSVSSNKGAYGLMQIRSQTAKYWGFDTVPDDETNIKIGTKLLGFLDRTFRKDTTLTAAERQKFVLASYNAGLGRVLDCRKFATIQNKNASVWDSVVEVIPLLSLEEHFKNDTLNINTPFGGRETIRFVGDILERYEHYKNFLPAFNAKDTITRTE